MKRKEKLNKYKKEIFKRFSAILFENGEHKKRNLKVLFFLKRSSLIPEFRSIIGSGLTLKNDYGYNRKNF